MAKKRVPVKKGTTKVTAKSTRKGLTKGQGYMPKAPPPKKKSNPPKRGWGLSGR